ncbi:hypothetical protein Cni_G09664 [Canna indica]|uniref:Uncharacterized protein n=1 Tax=Canna indica TaxID=4628 RepID=A0AAQ3Q6N5_9LILI|nr:hypothetical protein Cni_G09664 [Canna indica]
MAAGDNKWVVDIRVQLEKNDAEMPPRKNQSIYRVPACIKELNSKVYKPQVVSFGPYHHGGPDVAPMEEHKRRALLHFLTKVRKPIDELVLAMAAEVQQLRDAYQGLDEKWKADKDEFFQMIILDGCFMHARDNAHRH